VVILASLDLISLALHWSVAIYA